MNHFEELRTSAARKRDEEIQRARDTYSRIVKVINELDGELHGPRRAARINRCSIRELILEHMPKYQPFTISDVVRTLSDVDPQRKPVHQTVKRTVARMQNAGTLKSVARIGDRRKKLFGFADVDFGLDGKSLNSWVRDVFGIEGGQARKSKGTGNDRR